MPETRALALELASVIEPHAGPLLVRVELDQESAVQTVCADRTRVSGRSRARANVAAAMEQARPWPAGPDCLKSRRLDFNVPAAHFADVAGAIRECKREARARFDAEREERAAGRQASHYDRDLRECLDREQADRDQVWFFDSLDSMPSVFVGTSAAVPRRDVIRPGPARSSVLDPAVGVERSRSAIVDCMGAQGWVAAF